MRKTLFLLFALTITGIFLSSCQPDITQEQAISIAEKHLQQYGHYPEVVTRVEVEEGEGWTNQYWERFDQPSIHGKKRICWVVRFYYSGPHLDGQLFVFVDKKSGEVIGGTQTR